MELIGILIIIVGFTLKLDTIAVIVTAGISTGLVAQMGIGEILSTLGGHPQFVRPLVSPMAEGAAIAKYNEEEDLDKIKAYAAASDNIGNFYAQNIFIGNAGILLVASTMEGLGMPVDTLQLSKVAIPVAVIALAMWIGQNLLLDRKLKKKYENKKKSSGDVA